MTKIARLTAQYTLCYWHVVDYCLSQDSQAESEPELPPAEPAPARYNREEQRSSGML